MKIVRTTTDGMYTLTQAITQNAGNALAQVSMAIKNNTTTQHHVGILRYADVDAEGFPSKRPSRVRASDSTSLTVST